MIDKVNEYKNRISILNAEILVFQKKQSPLPMLRLGVFASMVILFYFFLAAHSAVAGIVSFIALVGFVFLSIYDSRLKRVIKRKEILVAINSKELAALEGDWSSFNAGNEFIDQGHDYTHDLDVFGEGSLFQFMNRTATIFGKIKLAEYFSNAFGFSTEIAPRQDAVRDLAGKIGLRQEIQLLFHESKSSASEIDEMNQWLNSESPVKNMQLLKVLAYALPSVTLGCLLLSVFSVIDFPVYLIVLQLIIVFLYARQTMNVQNIITSKSKVLSRYSEVLQLFEKESFSSNFLVKIQHHLSSGTKIAPSASIKQLATILKYMDSNLNLLVSILLNGLFMFNLHLLMKAENWKNQNRIKVPEWFEAIATFDALSSLANYSYNQPGFIFPDLSGESFSLNAKNMGHPLIAQNERVVNDITIQGWNQFYIITGANMSGKSTFLRTIGVNYLLAMAGAPVCATFFSFSPVLIHSSIRTSDSLVKHESYFYAELKRLKQIIDELQSGKQKLILLDEILKGTNSKDKQAGSVALIRQLLKYNSVGLFATHDLMLGELAELYPDYVKNLCFEIEIENDKMKIDYKLHNGVCKNLNATYLMKNMGILFDEK